jgi:hypothetical protein
MDVKSAHLRELGAQRNVLWDATDEPVAGQVEPAKSW